MLIVLILPVMLLSQISDDFKTISDIDEVKNRIRETSAQTQSISSDFSQEKHLTMMEEVLTSKGRFLFKKENNVKWEYYEPITYSIVIRGSRFIINNDGKISEYDTEANKLFREINNMIVMAIQGDFVDNADFMASFYQNDKRYLANLKPKNEMLKDILTNIEIYFSKKDMSVSAVRFIEPGEDFTKITFTNRRANINITDDQFEIR